MRLPLSFRGHNRNLSQEAGSVPVRSAVTIHRMESRTASPASRFARQTRTIALWLLPLALIAMQWFAGGTSVEAAVVVTPRLALVVFTDHRMADDEWNALSTALQRGFENLALETHFASGGFDVVRGDTLVPGVEFDVAVSIYLHGDCRLLAQPGPYTVHGALGWVLRDHGHIEPFIHVDCARIAEVLGQHVLGMNHATRDAAMAEAISRVVLHEWLHIATQNSAHSRDGISKRAFALKDLIPNYSHGIAPSGNGK
jgi:hypothetical protein